MTNNQLMGPAVVSQEPFNNGSILPESDYNYSWPIPFIYRDYSNSYQNPHDTLQWMKPGEISFTAH